MAPSSYQADDVGIPVLEQGGYMQGHLPIPGNSQQPRTKTHPYHAALISAKQQQPKTARWSIKQALCPLDVSLAFKDLAKDVVPFKSTLNLS